MLQICTENHTPPPSCSPMDSSNMHPFSTPCEVSEVDNWSFFPLSLSTWRDGGIPVWFWLIVRRFNPCTLSGMITDIRPLLQFGWTLAQTQNNVLNNYIFGCQIVWEIFVMLNIVHCKSGLSGRPVYTEEALSDKNYLFSYLLKYLEVSTPFLDFFQRSVLFYKDR